MRLHCLLACISVLIVGCATSVTRASTHAHHDVHTLEWGVIGVSDVQTLDPALVSDPTSISVASLIYGGLVRLDGHLRVQPDGASSWSISRDGKVYTFHIRPNLEFADGRRVTAQHFVGALSRALGPEGSAGSAAFYLNLIAKKSKIDRGQTRTTRGIRALNNSTLQITLSRPAAHFLAELAFPVAFVPDPSLPNRYGSAWTDHASGFGPFVVREWSHTRYLRLDRNPHYYAGVSAFKTITLHFSTDTSALSAYDKGSLDLVSGAEPGQILPGKRSGLRRVPGLALDYLAFNTEKLPFFRLNARRAFASVWSPAFSRVAMGAAAFPAHGLVPSAFGIAPTQWLATTTARAYLRAARYGDPAKLQPLTLVLPRSSSLHALAQELRQAWRTKLRVNVTVKELNPSNYSKVLSAHAFDLALVEWGGDYPDPQDFLGTQLGSSPDNITSWVRSSYDHAIALADSYSPNDIRRPRLFREAAELASQKVPILPLDEPAQSAVIRPQLTGVVLTPLGTIVGNWVGAKLRT